MANEKPKLNLIRLTLLTNKVVLLHQMLIKHTEKAAEFCAASSGESQQLFQFKMQKELVKQLLYKIDGKVVSMSDREDFDKLFTPQEYGQVLKAIAKIAGADDEKKEVQIALVEDSE